MMSKSSEKLYLVNSNGEVIEEIPIGKTLTYLNEGDKVFRNDGIEGIEKTVAIKMRFAKVNLKVFWELCHKYPILTKMLEYLQYQTGKLVYRNGVTINRKNLARACGVTKGTITRQIKGLIEEDVIKIVKNGRDSIFYVNPYIAHIGKKVNYSLYVLFKDTIYKKKYDKTLEGEKDDE